MRWASILRAGVTEDGANTEENNIVLVGMVGIEPTRPFGPQDFKSCAYASFATSPSVASLAE